MRAINKEGRALYPYYNHKEVSKVFIYLKALIYYNTMMKSLSYYDKEKCFCPQ